MKYDVAVVGLGGMGSAILAHAAGRGASAIGIEQHQAVHALGSSHGRSRMIRKSYFENSAYVPLLRRAYELWRELERAAATKIFQATGVLTVGEETREIVAGTRRASQEHDLPLSVLSRAEVQERYPTVKILTDEIALFEADAGVLDPEVAVQAHLAMARGHGATMEFGVVMTRWEATNQGFNISLGDGRRIAARTLILSLGPWFKETLRSLDISMTVQRNVQVWFHSATAAYRAPGFPAFLLDRRGLPAPLYGFPDFGHGVKAAFHGLGAETNAQDLDRAIDESSDVAPLKRAMEAWMPGAAKSLRDATACMYSLTPDEHFVIDRSPHHQNLILCGGFSGHGFKFVPVVGEIAAELALNGGTRHEIDFLSASRFQEQ
ncbi:MAG: N-methyl-L-tryptophan oxidase [Chthoniobacterales bacterium]